MFLVARIDYAITRGINWLTTCLVERARGFNSGEAGDYLDDPGDPVWFHDRVIAEAALERVLKTEPGMGCTGGPIEDIFRGGGQTFQTGPAPRLATTHGAKCACGHWLHPGNVCAACGCTKVRLTQTPAAGQRGESPAGVTPPTPAGSSEHHCDCGLSDDMEDLDTHAAVCTIWDGPTCYFCGTPTTNVVNTDCDGDTEFVCEKCAADEIGAHPVPTDPSPTSPPAPQPRVGDEGSPLDSAIPPAPRGERPTWVDWAVPEICDVLAVHQLTWHVSRIECWQDEYCTTSCGWFEDMQDWREHVAPLIAERLDTAAQDARPTQK